jgi:glucan 1,3-beta-glucosidase
MSQEQHIAEVCNAWGSYTGSDKWSFVGEWSGAMTDCAEYLNGKPQLDSRVLILTVVGYGRGTRYDGTFDGSSYVGSCAGINNLSQWSDSMKASTRRYIEKQIAAFEQGSEGWTFWNFKTERAPEWDFLQLLDNGIFPNPVSSVPQESGC